MEVRDLAWEDFPTLAENYLALYDEVREDPNIGISLFPNRPTMVEEADWFARIYRAVQTGTAVAVVAVDGGRAVGLCEIQPMGVQEGRHFGVLGLLVAKGRRGQGIGRTLIREALNRCRGKFESVELSVFHSNARARALYESMGFRVWGTLPKGVKREGRYFDILHMVVAIR